MAIQAKKISLERLNTVLTGEVASLKRQLQDSNCIRDVTEKLTEGLERKRCQQRHHCDDRRVPARTFARLHW